MNQKPNKLTTFSRIAKKATLLVVALLTIGIQVVHADPLAFIAEATGILQLIVCAIGAGLAIWGAVNLAEGYGNDNPGSKSQGIKQFMAGGGIILIGITLVPQLATLF